jgi:hypothetical protein
VDRYKNHYWHLVYDYPGRVWAEQDLSIIKEQVRGLGPDEEEGDFLCPLIGEHEEDNEMRLSFIRKEYHHSGSLSSLPLLKWGTFSSDKSLRVLAKCLDDRGHRESVLKAELKEALEARVALTDKSEPALSNELHSSTQTTKNPAKLENVLIEGDEEALKAAVVAFTENDCSDMEPRAEIKLDTAIKQRVRLREVEEHVVNNAISQASVAYAIGTVTGWRNATSTETSPKWQISLDKGGELFLDELSLIEGIRRHRTWMDQVRLDPSCDDANILPCTG